MRIGHKYYLVPRGQATDTAIANTQESLFVVNQYDAARDLGSREEFLRSRYFSDWTREAHEAFKASLQNAGRILSVGSGIGEHDVLLHLAGLPVISTDLLPGISAETQRLFPEMEFAAFDCFDEPSYGRFRFDSILATGLDSHFDDPALGRLFAIFRKALKASTVASPRLVFTIRYHDNFLTRLIDDYLLPLEARVRAWRGGAAYEMVRKAHGVRRSMKETARLAREEGFEVVNVRYAGRGIECERSGILRRLPLFIPLMRVVDRVFPLSCNCVILELVPE